MSKEIQRKAAQQIEIARAPTNLLEQRLDGLLRREVIRSAVEAVMLIAELAQRNANAQEEAIAPSPASARPGEQTDKGVPDGAAG